MKYHTYLPHPQLRPFIENYWHIQSERNTPAPGECCVVPDGNSSLMFIDSTVLRRYSHERQATSYTGQCVLVGQKSQPVFYTFPTDRVIDTYGVRFRSLGLESFLATPMQELTDQSLDATCLFGKAVQELHQDLLSCRHLPAGLSLLDNFFLQRLRHPTERHRLTSYLVQQIIRQKGQLKIAGLISKFGISARQIDRLFQAHVGLSPKYFARIVRFNHCIYLQKTTPFDKLTDLAYTNGYFDQMHFIKEVKFFTHQTPSQYFSAPDQMTHALEELLSERFGTDRRPSRCAAV